MTQSGPPVSTVPAEESAETQPSNPTKAVVARGPWALAWRRLRKDKVAMGCGVILVLLCLVAIFAPVIASMLGQQPNYGDVMTGLDSSSLPVGPSGHHLLGTDQSGRDLLVRIVYGTRVSLGIGLLSTILAVSVGVAVGVAVCVGVAVAVGVGVGLSWFWISRSYPKRRSSSSISSHHSANCGGVSGRFIVKISHCSADVYPH